MKKHAKLKNAQINRYSGGTGGGPPHKDLSQVDLEVLDMIKEVQRGGLKIGESPLEFSFAKDEEPEDIEVSTLLL